MRIAAQDWMSTLILMLINAGKELVNLCKISKGLAHIVEVQVKLKTHRAFSLVVFVALYAMGGALT